MAENESLDLTSRHARRWNLVRVAAHLRHTRILKPGESPEALIALLARSRDEWLAVAADGRRKGFSWARLLDPSRRPVSQGVSHAPA
jgi:hypothetical protein